MGKGPWRSKWFAQFVVALTYAAVYLAIRPFSDAHWALTSGLRLAALLLVPYRYWFALIVGEAVPLAYGVFACVDLYGYATAVIFTVPPIAVAMPIVAFSRSRLKLFPAPRVIDMRVLLACTLATSLLWALVTYAGFLVAVFPPQTTLHVSPIMIAGLFVGDYVAILTVTTWPLLLKIAYRELPWGALVRRASNAPLTMDMVVIAFPVLIALSWLSEVVAPDSRGVMQMMLFLPVAWLTLKYGWRGAAVSGPVATACLCLTTQSAPNPVIIQTQAFVAFAVTCLFLLGARITAQSHREERERMALKRTLRVAQQCLHQSDQRLRQTSSMLEAIGGALSITQGRILHPVRHVLAPTERQTLSKVMTATQTRLYRLAESMHPVAWRERGLPAALRDTVGRVLDEAGVVYACEIKGRGLSQLSPTVHQAIYRLACEAVTHVSGQQICAEVRLTLRGGMTRGRRWVVLRVVGAHGAFNVMRLAYRDRDRKIIGTKLGGHGGDVATLQDYAALFGGVVHRRQTNQAVIVSVLLHDAQSVAFDPNLEPRAPLLWVR